MPPNATTVASGPKKLEKAIRIIPFGEPTFSEKQLFPPCKLSICISSAL